MENSSTSKWGLFYYTSWNGNAIKNAEGTFELIKKKSKFKSVNLSHILFPPFSYNHDNPLKFISISFFAWGNF